MSDGRKQVLEKVGTGIYRVHARGCDGSGCRCSTYQATVWVPRDNRLIRKHFDSKRAAISWREDARGAVRRKELRAPVKTTIRDAGDALIAGMQDGSILDRKRKRYKPSTIRSYKRALDLRIYPEFGTTPLTSLEQPDVQAFIEQLQGDGLSASTIQNTLNPLQVIYRRAKRDRKVTIDPTDGLELPRITGRRDSIVGPAQAQALIDALPGGERALWGTAFYAGLRRGELRALRWTDVDLAAEPAVIHVRRTWDDDEGEVDVKSDAGFRSVPLMGHLRELIVEHGLATRRSGDDLVFGRTARDPFIPSTTRRRARKAWADANALAAEQAQREGRDLKPGELLGPLSPHEARHCAASYLIAAGLNAKQLSVYIGHSDIRTTYNVYGKLMPDDGRQAVALLDAFFAPTGPTT